MFKKLLIANRGEIACRVIKTAREMGVPTVAVFSEADHNALHVSLANEALAIGPALASESYLKIEQVLTACKRTGADSVHPGYGFLSENAEFAQRLSDAGISFVGPNIEAIRSMGDKITSKHLAVRAGVNTIPGHTEVIEDAEQAVTIADELGYPVMLKASAGGGGKGMRIARNSAECREGFQRATSEAQSAFGDARVFLERYIEQPRHIEIQVLADHHGNIVHLGERECSVQRRHQKIIEESPSPLVDDAMRAAMGEQAIALAEAVGYDSAGTVEFIVDEDCNFYFLEMNTRLQVEHPVTEIVTGLDLVEWMIRIAAGERLPFDQSEIRQQGWAIEARVYAEDPQRDFVPSAGRLSRYQPPRESDLVRIDTGVREGDEISIYYDPMIAKLITSGKSRDQAIASMRAALNQFYLNGVAHNLGFLAALVSHERFSAGKLSTNMIAEIFPEGYRPEAYDSDDVVLPVILAATVHVLGELRAASISGRLACLPQTVQHGWTVVILNDYHAVEVRRLPDAEHFSVCYNDKDYRVATDWRPGETLLAAEVDGKPVYSQVQRRGVGYRLLHDGRQLDTRVLSAQAAKLLRWMPKQEATESSRFLRSPMPGLLSSLRVRAGQHVKQGQELAVIEAMKMENILRAERDATVKETLANEGDTLCVDQAIIEYET